MNAEDFIDTNIFIYLFDGSDVGKRQRAETLVTQSLERGTGCTSYQVVQETMNVLTGTFGMSLDRVRRLLDDVLAPLWQINPSISLYQSAVSLQSRYRYSFYDSLIVASALEAGCRRLYSEDLQHRQQVQQVQQMTIQNPFLDL